ncbi:hypothetical protein AAVH_15984 [Aphelenchoides avenae]|nr:hypothetical protein AAVH_15984 [Aphelenchus avenae]
MPGYGCIRLDGERKNNHRKDADVGLPVPVFSSTKKIASNADDNENFDAEDQNAEEPEVKRPRKDDNDDPPAAAGGPHRLNREELSISYADL